MTASQATIFVSTHRSTWSPRSTHAAGTDSTSDQQDPASRFLDEVASGSQRAISRQGIAAAGRPLAGGRFLIARPCADPTGDPGAVLVKAIELDAADYARAASSGLWKWIEDPFLWDSPSFESALPMPLPLDDQPPPSPNASLERIRDRLIQVEHDRGIALIDGDSSRTLLRVLRRLSGREVPEIAWSIGLDPPPTDTRLAAAGPIPDGGRWLNAAPSTHGSRPGASLGNPEVPPRVRVVSGRVPTCLVILSSTLAGAAVVAAAAAWIARVQPMAAAVEAPEQEIP